MTRNLALKANRLLSDKPASKNRKGFAGDQRTPSHFLAGRPGFEPGLTESESVVLPLDDLPIGPKIAKSNRLVNPCRLDCGNGPVNSL